MRFICTRPWRQKGPLALPTGRQYVCILRNYIYRGKAGGISLIDCVRGDESIRRGKQLTPLSRLQERETPQLTFQNLSATWPSREATPIKLPPLTLAR